MEEEAKGWDSGEVEREVGSAERGYKEKIDICICTRTESSNHHH